MQNVTVAVPTERLGEFYQVIGRWLDGTAFDPNDEQAAVLPWSKGDADLARALYLKFNARVRAIVDELIDHAGQEISAQELANRHGIATGRHGLAGTFGRPGRYARELGRRLPIRWRSDGEPTVYWMEPDVAQLFRQARGQ